MRKLNLNVPTAAKRIVQAFFLLSVANVVWVMSGCSLVPPVVPPVEKSIDRKPKAEDSYSRGMRYYNDGFFESATVELKNVPASHLSFDQSQLFLKKANERIAKVKTYESTALKLWEQSRFSKARRQLEEALKVYPKHSRIQKLLKKLDADIKSAANLLYEKGRREFERGNYKEARAAFLEGAKINPKDDRILLDLSLTEKTLSEAHLRGGRLLFEEGRLDQAIEHLEKAYQITPADSTVIDYLANAYHFRALKFYREEKLDQAVLDLTRSLQIKPGQVKIQEQLSQIEKRLQLLNAIKP
ncbi:MAG: tetratricopeptide repeat protein [Nitrospiria bacterium]